MNPQPEIIIIQRDDTGNHLVGLTNLERLYLDGTEVTDAGLVHLAGLTNLKKLDLRDTEATDAGVTKLKETLPKCFISN